MNTGSLKLHAELGCYHNHLARHKQHVTDTWCKTPLNEARIEALYECLLALNQRAYAELDYEFYGRGTAR